MVRRKDQETKAKERTADSDNVRASRAGHEFHEAWTARKAMQLLLPKDGLVGIAVEGLSKEDQSRASAETVEVADLTVYYGRDANFRDANKVETLQFKYSPKRAQREFRASDAKTTIEKFAESYRDYRSNYGAAAVTSKLSFELITNRPIFPPFHAAIDALAYSKQLTGLAKTQADQFRNAAGLTGKALAEFASKCCMTGLAGTLRDTKTDLSKILVDWSATADAQAKARLGGMRDMVREKAGPDAKSNNVVRQVDVLDALGLSGVEDLLPCPVRMSDFGKIVKREQLAEAASLIPSLTKPLIIHADGGIGKTVFLNSLASILAARHEVVFFDCFGGGAYRSAEDGRHLPNRGLVHIANELACRGLCDPILPGSDNTETLLRTFRKRLAQCVEVLATASPDREVVLFIDAIDNAAEYAEERGQRAFPVLLLESIHHSGPIPGVRIVASGRTHRIKKYLNPLHFDELKLRAFSISETRAYLSTRIPGITEIEIRVAQSRSEGNGRILEHLTTSDRGLLDRSEIDKPIVLDQLLKQQIDSALSAAQKQGYKKEIIDAFLAGLSALPPPVPLDEYAGSHGLDIGAIRSFASDLAPMLDRTPQGLIFRDEPTETLVREIYGSNKRALRRVANILNARQDKSVYAAQALPGLLHKLGEGKKLFDLAFDERFPALISSAIGQRRIRYARLKAAVLHAAAADDKNKLVRLLLELSSVTASDQKGADYICNNPDLVVNAADADALRRLFETRTKWPGARHARLTVASVLSGDSDEAARHFTNALAWIRHDVESVAGDDYNRPHPERMDRAAIAIFRLVQGDHRRAISFMRVWYPWYAYELSQHVFELWQQVLGRTPRLRRNVEDYLDDLTTEIGPLAGALSFANCSDTRGRELIAKLARACKRTREVKGSDSMGSERQYGLHDGLRKAATIALSLGMDQQALDISARAAHERPSSWTMNSQHSNGNIFSFLFHVALKSAVSGIPVHERDILPSDLLPFAKRISTAVTGREFMQVVKKNIEREGRKERQKQDSEKTNIGRLKGCADRYFANREGPFLELTQALSLFLRSPRRQADKPFRDLVRLVSKNRVHKEGYYHEQQFNQFFRFLGTDIIMFALWTRSDLKIPSVRLLLKYFEIEKNILAPKTLIRVIAIIARRPHFEVIAGTEAIQAKSLIEREDNVETRAEMFADLARAILPCSPTDATEYFGSGLEQLDAIGSGDHDFTNELLLFASSVKGEELSEKDFHTLTNICELNMSYEAEKFPWGAFAGAMSRVSGPRGLAKLSRWHDRGKISLEYTLLPYLTALVRDAKIAPEDALALNRLACPAELWVCNTEAFAKAIFKKGYPNEQALFTELVRQYEENNSRLPSATILKALANIASDVLGRRHTTTRYLVGASNHFDAVIGDLNEQRNYRPSRDERSSYVGNDTERKLRDVRSLAASADPLDRDALESAVSQLTNGPFSRELEHEFFNQLRAKVQFANRQRYLAHVAKLEQIDSYAKFNELAHCKRIWANSSASLGSFYRGLVRPILDIHAEEFLSFDTLSGYRIKEVSDLTGVKIGSLARELTNLFAARDWVVPAAAWLGLASILSVESDEGHAQRALAKLLNSGAAKLTSTVTDGPWARGMYPPSQISSIAAGLVWQMLGSPRATDRWQAAHSVRRFAELGRWNVIDELVRKLQSKESSSFGAPELPFFYLHARLWLLIALARVAQDYPDKLAAHAKSFTKIALDSSHPHTVMRHFSAQVLLACERHGAGSLTASQRTQLEKTNVTTIAHRADGEKLSAYHDFYRGRPEGAPESKHKFSFDYDFEKYELCGLADVFGQPGWSIKDLVAADVHRLDPSVSSMYDSAGREMSYHRRGIGLTESVHTYGQYLAWHALCFVGAFLLTTHPVTVAGQDGGGWSEWLSYRLLTREDGLWLSDGMDRPPICTKVNVLEKGNDGLVLTGDKDKLLTLVGIDEGALEQWVVVEGDWKSPDDIGVHISSALVPTKSGRKLAKGLLKEDDMFSIWLPTLGSDDDAHERFRTEKLEYKPWIVCASTDSGKLDQYDPLSVISVERRPRFIKRIADQYLLRSGDPFQRSWVTSRKKIVATTDAWGYEIPYEEGGETGARLVCKTEFLRDVLKSERSDLIVLIKLRRYKKGDTSYTKDRYWHTVAVLRISKNLRFEYLAGPINKVQQLRF